MSNNTLVKRFEANTKGRDLIVGDVHGCFTKLQARLDEVGFNPEVDRLFSVGDLVDRGPESKQALEWIAKPWFHAVQGNHEDMAIRWGKPVCMMDAGNYAANGGGWNIANTIEERAEFSQAFHELPIAIELQTQRGTIGIVHAECPFESWANFVQALTDDMIPRSDLKAIKQAAMWSRSKIESHHDGDIQDVLAVVVGHTPMQRMTSLGNTIYIDTAGWHPSGAGFTLLDANTLTKA